MRCNGQKAGPRRLTSRNLPGVLEKELERRLNLNEIPETSITLGLIIGRYHTGGSESSSSLCGMEQDQPDHVETVNANSMNT